MNSDIWILCIKSEFMNLISLTWIHDMNSLLKIDDNSIFWIHGIDFSSEIWHMNSLKWIQKNHSSDFCHDFILEMNFYEFTNPIPWDILWFHIKSTQQQLNTINWTLVRQWKPCSSVKISTALRERSIPAAFARPISWINLETNRF